MTTWKRGFTLLEGLIVLALIGLILTIAALSLQSARAKTRDAQRLGDIAVLTSGLTSYWQQNSKYPSSEGVDLGAPGSGADMLTTNAQSGFVPAGQTTDRILLDADRMPRGPKTGEYYHYKGGLNGFSIRFVTERDTTLGKANVWYAHSNGLIDGSDELK